MEQQQQKPRARIGDSISSFVDRFIDNRIQAVNQGAPKLQEVPQGDGEALIKALGGNRDTVDHGSKGLGRRGLMFDPLTDSSLASGMFRPKGYGSGFINNHILKIVTRRDPIVSTIIHTRAQQVAGFCRLPVDRHDYGFQFKVRHPEDTVDPTETQMMEKFVLNCGETEGRRQEDKLTFDAMGYMSASDMLTYGHTAVENVLRRDGGLFAFLPLPGETIYHANRSNVAQSSAETMIAASRGSIDALLERSGEDTKAGPFAEAEGESRLGYVQVINGKLVQGFGPDDLTFVRVYTQADIDLQGYAMGPLERAISMVTAHLQIENHQKMFFTHGVASKGLLVIQGDITPNQLRTLQAQWNNQVTGPQAAWRTPILAGIKGVQWTPFMTGSRDMEYAAYQDHVLRVLHACFAIDPEETGFGYLSKGTEQRSLGESSNEWRVEASRDKGLRPLLGRLESMLNEYLLPKWNPVLANKYKFCFVGLDAETREEEIDRLKEEVQLHTTLDEAREEAQLEALPVGGGLILNPILLQTLQANLPKGVFMETFMNVSGASSRPDLQYIPDPFWFQFQQMQIQMQQQLAMAQQGGDGDEDEDEDDHEGDDSDGDVDDGGADDKGDKKDKKGPPFKKKGKGNKKPPSKGDKGKDGDDEEEEGPSPEEQAAAAQGVEAYIQGNPHLFKSLKENLAKSDMARNQMRVNDNHVQDLAEDLCDDFDHGADMLVKEILAAVSDEMRENSVDQKSAS